MEGTSKVMRFGERRMLLGRDVCVNGGRVIGLGADREGGRKGGGGGGIGGVMVRVEGLVERK